MAMKRLILVIKEDLLREAQTVAARRRTSITEKVCQFLKDMVNQEGRRLAASERIQPLLDRPAVQLAPHVLRDTSFTSADPLGSVA